ncbi:MAG: bifunctional phosphoglucose/phosphomannose isomerase [Candidatus Heimdallarchaeota archaeon]|nr:MAG: bifunctional phosphoglucose/phosphomannose isomerase [Candidatus Heimdallarchaeota archaeon]
MVLDNLANISELDSQNMFQMVYNWAELVEELLQQTLEVPAQTTVGQYLISYTDPISQIVICGMGGSAVSGDYLRIYLEKISHLPIIIQRNYDIPNFVSKNTLLILISYSGNTEETISCLISAIKKTAKIVGIGSGGNLKDFLRKHNIPFFLIPSGFQPRASFPLLFFPLLKILATMNLVPMDQAAIDETIFLFRQMRQEFHFENPIPENQAKQIAQRLQGRIPIIWSPFACIANRMKCQLNENSKILAMAEELPEFNHNHIVGWESWTEDNPFIVIAFRFQAEHPNVKLRFEITKDIVKKKVEIIEISARGNSFLSQLFSATYFGDYISIYLAILNNQDPNTVDSIVFLKEQLEQREQTQTKLIATLHSLREKIS